VLIAFLFNMFLLTGCTLSAIFGGSHERKFVGFLLASTLLTLVFLSTLGRFDAQAAIMIIDVLILLYAAYLVFQTNRYWPIWFAGFHSLTVLSDVVQWFIPSKYPDLFALFSGFWALPAVLAMAIGIIKDHRASLN
jgi:hypothetical protein